MPLGPETADAKPLDGALPLELSREKPASGASLLERLLQLPLGESPPRRADEASPLAKLLACRDRAELAELLFAGSRPSAKQAARMLEVVAAHLEAAVARQVNAILHHPRFQALEASWRGLEYLWARAREEMEQAEELGEDCRIVLRVLPASKRELRDDAAGAIDFDQTALWHKVYEAEFGQAGGTPFGLLVGDYEFRNHPDDLDTLASISAVAAAAFAPFVAAASPQFFGLADFQRLELGLSLEQDFLRPDYVKWRSLRESDDARFVGLTLPRVLMRRPYRLDVTRNDGFRFAEEVAEEGRHSRYLWGNAAYAFGAVVLRAYATSGWFADIRGFERGQQSGGLVVGPAVDSFATDADGIALKTPTDVAIGGAQERELSELGFVPLCPCPGTEYAAFFSNASIHKPKRYAEPEADTTARMSAMLQYVLCASRFAHYLKTLCRERLGSFQSAEELQSLLSRWIHEYVADDPRASPEMKARYPLRQAEISVGEIPGKPGAYRLEMQLLPHYQLDALSASLRLVHRLGGSGA